MPASARAGIFAPAAQAGGAGKLQITLVKSPIGQLENQKLTVKALGLRRMQQTVVRPDTPSVRGMVYKVRHLVRVETAADDAALGVVKAAKRGSGATVIRSAGQASASQASAGQEPTELEPTELEPATPTPATHETEGAAPGGTDATA